ncbi:MAG: YlbF/YmcA family competence regulator [Planctomycetota bacterium]|jgi:cell fate (sporulation/competence/biofilm development) regulator YlbF (YheA/YmcA/DUF963 family)
MDQILKVADELGQVISNSNVVQNYRTSREAMNAEPETMELLQGFMQQSSKIMELTQKQEPIEPDEKHKLNDIHAQLVARDAFKAFSAAQVEYVDMMRKVQQAMMTHLQDIEGQPAEQPEGQA